MKDLKNHLQLGHYLNKSERDVFVKLSVEQKLQQEALTVLTNRCKERVERMKREKSDGEEQLRRDVLEEEQRRKNEDVGCWMLAKQTKEEGRVVRKRKSDQLDASNKQPAAPECPVCLLERSLLLTI